MKPTPKKVTKNISAAETKAAKRTGMIAVMRDVSLSREQANAELVRVGMEPMTAAEAAEYDAAINAVVTTADILGKVDTPAPAPKAAKAEPTGDTPEVPQPVKVAVLRKALDTVGGLLRVCAPSKVAEYKAMKAAGKRPEAYGFALTEIMKAVGE